MNYHSKSVSDTLQKNSPFAIVITNIEGVIEVVNDKAEAMFGYNSKELLGKPIELLVPEALRENHIKHRRKYNANPHTRAMGLGYDLIGLRKNGEEFPVEIGLHFDHKKGQVISFITDITKRKQIEQDRLHHFEIEKENMERELQNAHKVQVDLLPHEIPKIPGWSFAVNWLPAGEVSGDFYDFIHSNGNNVDFVIADVTDKGIPAALYMAFISTVLRTSLNGNSSLAEGIKRNNELMFLESNQNMLVTLFLARLNTATGETSYVNAGHNPPLVYDSQRDQLSSLSNSSMALGLSPHASFDQHDILLNSGDFILSYTDGITEAMDEKKQFFGNERLQHVLYDNRHNTPENIVNGVVKAVNEFSAPSHPSDDITIMVAKRE